MDATIWYEPTLEKTYAAPDPDQPPPEGEWKILCRDDAVSVLAPKAGQLVLVATGRWNGKHVKDRYLVPASDPISRTRWARFEYALHRAQTGIHRPFGETEYARISNGPPVEHVPGVPSNAWAIASIATAILGAVIAGVAWRSGDSIGRLLTFALIGSALGLTIFSVYGARTSCPRCGSWFRRLSVPSGFECRECEHRWTGPRMG